MMKIGILPLGRTTFDVEYASEKLRGMLRALDQTGHEIVGSRNLLVDEPSTLQAIDELQASSIDQLLVLQVTFTDAAMTETAARAFRQPLSLWATPEPRLGGRLRLNAFCGLNLASHALSLQNRAFSWMYVDPESDVTQDLQELLAGKRQTGTLRTGSSDGFGSDAGRALVRSIRGKRIARIGEHPTGFATCAYSAERLADLAGIEIEELSLQKLFDTASNLSSTRTQPVREEAESTLSNLDRVNAEELERSLRLKSGLDVIRHNGDYDAFAIRCWPETFTEYGAAVCGPVAMMVESGVPCACEADVYGAVSQLIMQAASESPVFLTDLVDMDIDDNSGVVWHCGQAPVSMRDPDTAATATIHTNRKMPLLYEFPLKPGAVTLMRISQAYNEPRMVLGQATMLKRPRAYTGTSGVLRFGRQAGEVLKDLMDSGLEHHMVLAYGDHRTLLRSVAAALNLPIVEL